MPAYGVANHVKTVQWGHDLLAQMLKQDGALAVADSMVALAEDHLNDVMSNVAAVGTAAIAANVRLTYLWHTGQALMLPFY